MLRKHYFIIIKYVKKTPKKVIFCITGLYIITHYKYTFRLRLVSGYVWFINFGKVIKIGGRRVCLILLYK